MSSCSSQLSSETVKLQVFHTKKMQSQSEEIHHGTASMAANISRFYHIANKWTFHKQVSLKSLRNERYKFKRRF
jgi:hypothetical protein